MRCLVTGGSRNVGRQICRVLAERGAKVAFTYLERDDAANETFKMLAKLTTDPLKFCGDVSDCEHARRVVKSVCDAYGGLDVLINNASVTQIVPMALLEESDWDRTMAVNVKGAFLFSREALKPMLRQKRGKILNVGSFSAGRVVSGTPVHFAASKAALIGFSTALASEVGRYGISVNVLSPGLVDAGLSERLPPHRVDAYKKQCPAGRLMTAEEVANAVAFWASDEANFVSGTNVILDGGL